MFYESSLSWGELKVIYLSLVAANINMGISEGPLFILRFLRQVCDVCFLYFTKGPPMLLKGDYGIFSKGSVVDSSESPLLSF